MKNQNQEDIQSLMDHGDYAPMYPFISTSNLSDFQKILVSHMLNDIRMNGTITWKHESYASKMNSSRVSIWKQFKVLTICGIIIPFENNKAGSKNNKFGISFNAIAKYKPVNQENLLGTKKPVNTKQSPVNEDNKSDDTNLLTGSTKPVNDEQQPVNDEQQPVNAEQKPVNPGIHIKKPKENKKNNKKIIKEQTLDDILLDDIDIGDLTTRYHYKPKPEIPKKDISQRELESWLDDLDI